VDPGAVVTVELSGKIPDGRAFHEAQASFGALKVSREFPVHIGGHRVVSKPRPDFVQE